MTFWGIGDQTQEISRSDVAGEASVAATAASDSVDLAADRNCALAFLILRMFLSESRFPLFRNMR
jgi:hypothetical protein